MLKKGGTSVIRRRKKNVSVGGIAVCEGLKWNIQQFHKMVKRKVTSKFDFGGENTIHSFWPFKIKTYVSFCSYLFIINLD